MSCLMSNHEYISPLVDVLEVNNEGFMCMSVDIEDWEDAGEDFGGSVG